MTKIVDLTDKKFVRWSVKGLSDRPGPVKYWDCVCECGNEKSVFGGDLKRGESQSCGCLALEMRKAEATTHGMAHHPAYRNWIHAKTRCENPADDNFKEYGARGIKVCERWVTFEAFWGDMGSTWDKGLTLDRIDNERGYEPGNVRWATPKEQANNRRTNRIIDTPLGRMNITQAAEASGLNRATICTRLASKWPAHRLFDGVAFNMRWHGQPK